MKKAVTTKRERKYGKKETKVIEEVVKKKERKKKEQEVTVMVDYGMIRKFPSKAKAEIFINNNHKEADEARRPRSSFTYI